MPRWIWKRVEYCPAFTGTAGTTGNSKNRQLERLALVACFFVILPSVICARPTFTPAPLGFEANAFSGGGVLNQPGVGAVFQNPAGQIFLGEQIELGLMGFGEEFSPYFLFGSRANNFSTYTLGAVRDARDSLKLQGLVGGFAFTPGDYMSGGISMQSQALDQKYGIDLNAGLQYRPHPWIRAGAAGHQILESGFGQAPESQETRRAWLVGAGVYPFAWERISINAETEFNHVTEFDDYHYRGSLEALIGPQNNMNMVLSIHSWPGPSERPLTLGLGSSLQFPSGFNRIRVGYAFENLPLIGQSPASNALRQCFTFKISLSSEIDRLPPELFVRLDRALLSPSASDSLQKVYFQLEATDKQSALDSWYLVICETGPDGDAGKIVYSFMGKGLAPKTIQWDGRDSRREFLGPGFYAYRFIASDLAHNVGKTRWQVLEIR